MKLTNELRKFITTQRDLRGWTNADLARESGYSEATWSRILNETRLQKSIKDDLVSKIGELFGSSPLEIMLISQGRPVENSRVMEPDGTYTAPDQYTKLSTWFRSSATEDQRAAIIAIAKTFGYKE